MAGVQERIARALRALGVVPGDALGVACSGGPDSAALAHACLALSRRGALGPVTLLHVHHGLRADADADAALVRALAEQGGGRAVIRHAGVDRDRASLEAAAREARYATLDGLAVEHGLRWIATAHTASDQAETVLMRVLRGTGVPGLAGIPRVRGIYVRPLLALTRAEIEAYCRRHRVAFARDPMNEDPAFLRNRVRHRWLPALRAENPCVEEALCRLADAAAGERAVLEWAAERLLAEARVPAPAGLPESAVALALAPLGQAPVAVRRRAASLAATCAGVGPLAAGHLRAIDALALRATAGNAEGADRDTAGGATGGSARLSLPGGAVLREYDRLVFVGRAGPAGEEDGAAQPGAARIQVAGPDGPYLVRLWRPGDRMRPARLRGRSRKLGDLFIDARVPRRLRARAVIVVRAADGVIVWAEHIGPAFGSEVSVRLTPGNPLASNKVSD